jgi:membrane-associated phospholipid phosphatase
MLQPASGRIFRLIPVIYTVLILLIGACAVYGAAQVEALYVYDLWLHPWPWFRDFMAHSIFEGEAFGGSDIGVLFAIICFFAWLARRRGKTILPWFSTLELRFIWLASLLTSIVSVHSLKWIISRARPKIIFTPEYLGIDPVGFLTRLRWPGFMPMDGPRGLTFNSFPSGHTAACAILMTVSYVCWRRKPGFSAAFFMIVMLFCVLMAVARSMAGMHWISDSIASFFITWAVIHSVHNFKG